MHKNNFYRSVFSGADIACLPKKNESGIIRRQLEVRCLCVVLFALAATGCAHDVDRKVRVGEPVTFDAIPPQSVKTQSLRDVRFRRYASGETYIASEWTKEPSIWPVDTQLGEVISRFGPRGRSRKMHNGIDIKAPRGTTVVATADGEVVLAERRSGYGNYVEIDHGDGVVSAYGHFERIGVEAGERVQQGMPIGTVGASGNASTPHVHYEVRIDNQEYDPWLFLPALNP